MTNEVARTGALIGNIYEAALDRNLWPSFMENLGSSLNAGFGNLWMLDSSDWSISSDDAGSVSAASGLDTPSIDQYKHHYAAVNVWLPNALKLPEGSLTLSSALFPDRLLKGTEFYDGFLRPNDLFYALGCSVLKQTGTRDVRFSFLRSARAGQFTPAELRRVRLLIPHLRNAVMLHGKLHRSRALASSAMAALELVPVGIMLIAGSGLLMHANQRALDLCALSAAVHIKAGALHAASTASTTQLQCLIRDAIRTSAGKGAGHGGALQLVGADGRRLHVLVTPLPADSAAVGGGAMAAIFCSDPDAIVGTLAKRLEGLYHMTPAEARLTEALVNGQSLGELADTRRTTMNTVRSQLKAALSKVGARRQSDLVRIVLTGPAIFGAQGAGDYRANS